MLDADGETVAETEFSAAQLTDGAQCTLRVQALRPNTEYTLVLASTDEALGYRINTGESAAEEVQSWAWGPQQESALPEVQFYYPRTLRTTSFMLMAGVCLAAAAALVCPLVPLPCTLRRLVPFGLLAFFAGVTVYCLEALAPHDIGGIFRVPLALNLVLAALIYFALYGLSHRVWVSALAGALAMGALGVANHFTQLFRGEQLLPSDILGAGTAMNVIASYSFRMDWSLWLSLACFALILALAARQAPADRHPSRRRRLALLGGGVCAAVCAWAVTTPAFLDASGVALDMFRNNVSAQENGVLLNFFANLQYLRYSKPDGYSDDFVLQNASGTAGTAQQYPDIVVIMNESFTDLNDLGQLEISQDYLPFIHSLEDSGEAFVGRTVVPVFGAGTCCTEFEALTGFSLANLVNARSPFVQYTNEDVSSLVRSVQALGYTDYSFHLLPGKNWSRDTAYPHMGFTRFDDYTALGGPFEQLRTSFATDRAHMQILLEELDTHTGDDAPHFSFSVTVQNHGGYDLAGYTSPYTFTNGWDYPQALQYIGVASESDKAFETLLTALSERERPTIVLMFGDHLPNVEPDFYSDLLGQPRDSLTGQARMQLYETPFILWANYDADFSDIPSLLSANYLQTALLRAAGLPLSGFGEFLSECMDAMPVYSSWGFIDADGVYYDTLDGTPYEELRTEYTYWQYAGLRRWAQTSEAFLPS